MTATQQRAINIINKMPEHEVEQFVLLNIRYEQPKPKKRTFGCMKDAIAFVADDFDSYIEDNPATVGFEEYM